MLMPLDPEVSESYPTPGKLLARKFTSLTLVILSWSQPQFILTGARNHNYTTGYASNGQNLTKLGESGYAHSIHNDT